MSRTRQPLIQKQLQESRSDSGTAPIVAASDPDSEGIGLVHVVLPVPVDRAYSYACDRPLSPGAIVEVPLGPRLVTGVVWRGSEAGGADKVDPARIREVERIFDAPLLSGEVMDFVEWVARYSMVPLGLVLKMVLRSPAGLEPEQPISGLRLGGPPPDRMTPARMRVLETVEDGLAWSKSGLARSAGVSPGVIDGLIQHGTLEVVQIPQSPLSADLDPSRPGPDLSEPQQTAAQSLEVQVAAGRYSATLLDGVTGSGKTEVYLEAVAKTLGEGGQALVLLPEIALTGAFVDRFSRRFGSRPAEWHSDVSTKMRARVWRGVADGSARLVLGARSALFLPYANLRLIVVDEEHDPAYKQEDGVIYNARDMAVVRASIGGFPVILSSATPSVETWVNASRDRYNWLRLPRRHGSARPPRISAIDMRQDQPPRGSWISPPLDGAIREALGRGEQALLMLNRRGYAPLTLCRTCGYRFSCPNCSAWLIEHRFRKRLMCHHCGFEEAQPQECPQCGDTDSLVACGPGVERLEEDVLERYPEARTLVLSSDMPGGTARLRLELQAIADGEVDLIIGTQLVAKGHDFPGLTLVGVIDADLGLAHGDPRAAERTFQLLTQVTGRAGRREGESQGLLQTYAPEHPVIQALVCGDRKAFYDAECDVRERGGLPPFGRLAAIIVSAAEREHAADYARSLARVAPKSDQVKLLGPAEAPMAIVRGRYRFRLLAQAKRSQELHTWLKDWLAQAPKQRGSVRMTIDIDPMSFM